MTVLLAAAAAALFVATLAAARAVAGVDRLVIGTRRARLGSGAATGQPDGPE